MVTIWLQHATSRRNLALATGHAVPRRWTRPTNGSVAGSPNALGEPLANTQRQDLKLTPLPVGGASLAKRHIATRPIDHRCRGSQSGVTSRAATVRFLLRYIVELLCPSIVRRLAGKNST